MAAQPSPRRRLQFRLRTLMIGVTLLAVACWGIMDRQRLIRERDEAVLEKNKLRGDVRALTRELDQIVRLQADSKPPK